MLEITSRYFENGQYKVVLQETQPDLLIIPMRFNEDLSDLTSQELIDKVLEMFYRERFEGKFNREAVSIVEKVSKNLDVKVQEINNKVSTIDATVNMVDKAIIKLEEHGSKIKSLKLILDGIVKMTELPDDILIDVLANYNEWEVGINYTKGEIIKYNGKLYSVIQSHTAEETMTPDNIISRYVLLKNTIITSPENGEVVEVISEFDQQYASYPGYKLGEKVMFNSKVYESIHDGVNTWSPTGYPQAWKLVI